MEITESIGVGTLFCLEGPSNQLVGLGRAVCPQWRHGRSREVNSEETPSKLFSFKIIHSHINERLGQKKKDPSL